MKKLLLTIIAGLILLLAPSLAVGRAAAVNVFQPCSNGASKSSICTDATRQQAKTTNPVITVLKVVIQLLALVIGIASVIIIVVSGLRLVLSNGDSQGVSSARSGIVYALVGLVVAVSAQALVAFVLNKIN